MNRKTEEMPPAIPAVRARIVGPGSSNADVCGYAGKLPRDGETVMGNRLRIGAGGKGSNQMTAAARAGGDVCILTRLGQDAFGEVLRRHFDREGFRTDGIRTDKTASTGCALIGIDETTAENRIMVIPGANACIGEGDVLSAEKDFAEADVVLTQLEIPAEAVEAALGMAIRYGKPFLLNPAPFRPLSPAFLSHVDWLTPNETEAEALTGVPVSSLSDARKAARILLAAGVRHVVITRGKNGCFWTDGLSEAHIPAIPVRAVDTTGAGDTFNGALAVAVGEGMSPVNALRFATCAAALSVTRPGAADSAPMRPDIDALCRRTFGV